MSPPVPHPSSVQGVPCGTPEGFVVTPHNIIDQLLTAPSPYSSPSPAVASFQQPETAVGSPSGVSTPDAGLPLLVLVLTARHQDNSKCFAMLTRIFRNNYCLSPCIVVLAAP